MTDVQLVDKNAHKDLSVDTQYLNEYGYSLGSAAVLNTEIVAAQKEYPIIFRKHPETGKFIPNLLLGFSNNENLYIDDSGKWNAEHIPLAIAKGPFFVGFQKVKGTKQMSACIDLSDPRVNESGKGEPLFQSDGSLSPYMEYVSQILLLMHDGAQSVVNMVDLFVELNLIEQLNLEVQLENGEKLGFKGGFTIAEERLSQLTDSEVLKLYKSGFFPHAYYIAHSIENVRKLIDIKNKRIMSA